MLKELINGLAAAIKPQASQRPSRSIPDTVRPALESAAIRYASASPLEFESDVLYVSAGKLRERGLIDSQVWADAPSNDIVKVIRAPDGGLIAQALLVG